MPRSFISEDDIEKTIMDMLHSPELGYEVLYLDPSPEKKEDLNDGTGRIDKSTCVLPEVLRSSLKFLNPQVSSDELSQTFDVFSRDYSFSDIGQVNFELYQKIREGQKIDVVRKGKEDFDLVKIIDFDNPENNVFTAVSQMWIKGRYGWRRPDILVFVNGLPLVFIELKNSTIKVEEAYSNNLSNYKKDIPNVFALNQICVLSNGIQTRIGAWNATYDYFFQWLKVNSEDEKPDRKMIQADMNSEQFFVRGLLNKKRLLDYIENFVMFDNGKKISKVIAENHQYLGVNNLMSSLDNRKKLLGKLGVFWHTQGSGKSYSMIFFARKVFRKRHGNFSFLIVTDRDELDQQLFKTFVRTGTISKNELCKPKSSGQLRDYLRTNKPFVFTLIHKFRYDKGKTYPVLSKRDDIIVMVDEAHRTE